ncbi:MAG: Maf family nucleotide pyrophosphatase [Pseudomonadota bacterium]|nr:Maf family nucleotide pyrophosphatase [Pseudomonadota bacterium]
MTSPLIPALILASSSRYRQDLLQRLGLPFRVVPPEIDETPRPGEPPAETAIRLAEAKTRAVAPKHPEALIIGSDQVAEFHGKPVGKPHDRAHALKLLQAMRGHTVIFHTAVALLNARTGVCRSALVDVVSTFRHLDAAALEAYLEREMPFDCAGSVKSEGLGIALFTRVASDDPTALIGLPLIRLIDLLAAEGVQPLPRN